MNNVFQTDPFASVVIKAESVPMDHIPFDRKPSHVSPERWAGRVKRFLARYELAEHNPDLNEQFARATASSGRSVLGPTDRQTMVDRVRHEMHEGNPWLKGSARTTVVSVVGRGPWLEVELPGKADAARKISTAWNLWFRNRVKGPRKMRVMEWAHQSDGSGLALITTNRSVRGKVKLDFVPFDQEHIRQNPGSESYRDRARYLLDGKEFDAYGNPSRYWITDKHPVEYPEAISRPVSAEYVLDLWTWERPSQGRGVSPYVTSVKNGPLLRTFRRAVIDAATTAAKLSFLLETTVDKFENGEVIYDEVDPGIGIPLSYGEGMSLPAGWKANQMKAEQPTVGHGEFIRDNVSEMGRGAGQPTAVATGDQRNLSFSGGIMGRQDWEADVDVQRQDWESECLDKLLEHWLPEAALEGVIPKKYADIDNVPHTYRWTRKRHQDTQKEYTGRAKAIASGQGSRAHWLTDDGLDPQAEDEAAAAGFGVDIETYRKALFLSTFGDSAAMALGIKTDEQKKKESSDAEREPEDEGEEPPDEESGE